MSITAIESGATVKPFATLGEALAVRLELQRRFRALLNDAAQCARRVVGSQPTREPERLLQHAEAILDELEVLARVIARATAEATTSIGEPLVEAMAASEVATLRKKLWADVTKAAADDRSRSWGWGVDGPPPHTEPNLSLAEARFRAQGAAAHAGDLDVRVKACQWSTPLERPA